MQQMAQLRQDATRRETTVQTDDCPKNFLHPSSSVLIDHEHSDHSSVDLDQGACADVLDTTDEDGDMYKWHPRAKDHRPALQAGSIVIPEGAENCLAGLSFVFAGQLTFISKQEAQDLVKRYGGKCMSHPSKMTSFVILGVEAGPRKLATIKEHNLSVIDEKDFFALISRLPPRACPVLERKKEFERRQKEIEKIKNAAEDILATTVQGHQRDTSFINPHSVSRNQCEVVKNAMEGNMTRLELDPLDDQEWTNYAHMLEDHAAAVAEEPIYGAEVVKRLALARTKPTWREREAAKAAGDAVIYDSFRRN